MDYQHIIIQMLSILGIVLVGFASARRGLWAPELDRKLSVFVINVSMPALIISSAMNDEVDFERSEIVTLLLAATLNYLLLLGMAYVVSAIWRVPPSRRGLLRFMLAFGNISFIGYPVVDAIFGPRAVFCTSVVNIPYNLIMFTFGTSFIRGTRISAAFRPRQLLTPCIAASLVAMTLALLRVRTPAAVADWFHLLGDITIPCALLIIGSSLSHISVRDMLGNRFVYTAAGLRLFLLPLLVMGMLRLLGVDPFITNVLVVLSAMPVATNGVIFCLQYGKDERVMTQALFITTVLSVVSIPLLSALF